LSGHVGRFINDSITKKEANCVAKNVMMGQLGQSKKPNICFFASKMIYPGEELLYCYGETDEHMYWRLVSNCYFLTLLDIVLLKKKIYPFTIFPYPNTRIS